MKKIICILTIMTLFLTGCGIKADLDIIDEELSSLSTNAIRVNEIDKILQYELVIDMKDIKKINDNDLKLYSLDNDILSNYVIRTNTKTGEMYFILLPKVGKKEEVKKSMLDYFNGSTNSLVENRLEKEIEGYLVYIVSNDNERTYDIFTNKQTSVFTTLFKENDESLKLKFNIDVKNVKDYLIKTPYATLDSNMYIIINPKFGKQKEIKNLIDTYLNEYQEQWKDYDDYQYNTIKNRLETEYKGYLIYIASSDNEKVLEIIKENIK